MITSEEIKARLWNGANELRGSMDASRYESSILYQELESCWSKTK